MTCRCEKCPNKNKEICEKERLKFDVRYFRELLRKAEGSKRN